MHILYLTYDGLCDPLGQSQILPYILGNEKNGLKFSIVSAEKSRFVEINKNYVDGLLTKKKIDWYRIPYTKKPPLVSTFKDLLAIEKLAGEVIEKEDVDIIHCRGYLTAWTALRLKDKYNKKVIFDIRGFWPDERMEGGIWSRKNLLQKKVYLKLKKLEPEWFRKSDKLVSLTEKGKKVMSELAGINSESISVIPCCADENHFDPDRIPFEQRIAKRKELGLQESDRVLGYAGSLGTWYMGEEMMKQFKKLQSDQLFNKFLWLTNESPEAIAEYAAKFEVDSKDVIAVHSSRADMPTYLNTMDAGIFFIRPTFSKQASSPTKMAEMLMMGLPVITNTLVGDMQIYFEKHPEIGWLIDIKDAPLSLPKEMESLFKEPQKEQIRQAGIDLFSLKKGINSYHNIYKSLSEVEN